MKTNKKLFLIPLTIIVSLFLLYKLSTLFAPGSYPNAKYYEFDFPEKEVIEATNKLKQENLYLRVGNGWEDNDSTDYWHHIYFNFHNKMLLTWTRPSGKNNTTFAVVRIRENSEWKNIEESDLENQIEKEVIEKLKIILDKNK